MDGNNTSPPAAGPVARAAFAPPQWSEAWARRLNEVARAERGRIALWSPVAVAMGVAASFARSGDPTLLDWALVAVLALASLAAWRVLAARGGAAAMAGRIAALAVALFALGMAAAESRIARVAAPIWSADAAGRGVHQLSGRVIAVLPGRDGAPRLRLDRIEIEGFDGRVPARIDLRLADAADGAEPLALVDRRIALSARLFAPPGPAEPGAFDFRRRAYFLGVGALGVQRDRGRPGGVRDLGPAAHYGPLDTLRGAVSRLRADIAQRARQAAPGVEGAVIAALLVGDRSGLPEPTVQDLRDANLGHLLAISGLHMALVSLTVFGALRLGLALPTPLPAQVSPKKVAAVLAILSGAAYLALAGGGTATERAFVMIAVAFGAVLVDRPAVTLRAVALAALILLLARPESLFDAGFQLSFAATTALVAVFEASRGFWRRGERGDWRRRAALWAAALLVSSFFAGLATAPFAALAFNRLTRYGLLANLAAVPAMGAWIMPSGVAALALYPLGFDTALYPVMAVGVSHVLWVAQMAASAPDAVLAVQAPGSPWVAPLLALGGLWLCLWRTSWIRALGVAPLAAALALWGQSDRPDLLIARDGRLLGLEIDAGRQFDRDPTRSAYAAELWLRRDGDGRALQEIPRAAFRPVRGGRVAVGPAGWRIARLSSRRLTMADLARECRPGTLLVTPGLRRAEITVPLAACASLTADEIRAGGGWAVWFAPGELRLRSARSVSPDRRWVSAQASR
ncbi:MAG: ComEC/Rec2 family competence protein [Pseudomonadota bacterium]